MVFLSSAHLAVKAREGGLGVELQHFDVNHVLDGFEEGEGVVVVGKTPGRAVETAEEVLAKGLNQGGGVEPGLLGKL